MTALSTQQTSLGDVKVKKTNMEPATKINIRVSEDCAKAKENRIVDLPSNNN